MDNVLITGASGFIGSFLTEEGLKRDYRVYAGIRRSSSKEYLKDERIRFIEMDFSSVEKIADTLEDCKKQGITFRYIIHNAGLTKARKKDDYQRVNFVNTRNFIEALIKTGTVPEKFIFVSSLAAFGPGNPETMAPVLLSDTPNPIELYGKSKLEAEKYLNSLESFPWLIFRPTGVYGPREKDYYIFFKTINRGLETYIGSKPQILTFIYVRDLVRLIFDALPSSIVRKGYFVSDGREYDTQTFAAITKEVLGKKTIRITVPAGLVKQLAAGLESLYSCWGGIPTLNRDKYNVLASSNWRCEVEPLQRDFGFNAEYDLEKGVRETIAWYKKEHWL
ncbi:MAG: NAD(P)-dependent oxidoreductase [Bacteroidetes bacterium]|nr:NAD(P)-dependent oxidoreductase [Bacteroidota bacterium]